MLLLVRPAHAGDKQRWQGSDSVRPLSVAGRAEAARLLVRLEDYLPPLPLADVLIPPSVPHGASAEVLRQASQRCRRDGATLLSTIR